MPGPAPKPDTQRRRVNKVTSARTLPGSGRQGSPPKWPLPGRMLAGEKAMWAQLWATPQAVAWESLGWVRAVARYARVAVAAEQPDARSALLVEARQFEDRLGLSPLSMLRLHWATVDDESPVETAPVTMLADYRSQVAEGS